MEQKTAGKRFAKNKTGRRPFKRRMAVMLFYVGIGFLTFLGIVILVTMINLTWLLFNHPAGIPAGVIAVLSLVVCAMVGFNIYIGTRAIKATKLLRNMLFTDVSACDLPAVDSLVRASDKPADQQQSVLLRAVVETPETPPEQLLRPASIMETAPGQLIRAAQINELEQPQTVPQLYEPEEPPAQVRLNRR